MSLSRRHWETCASRAPIMRAFARRGPRAHRHAHDHHHSHDHAHPHVDDHSHDHDACENRPPRAAESGDVVVIRPSSGLSGDMILAGLARMADVDTAGLRAIAGSLGLPADCVSLERRAVNNVFGWGCRVSLPDTTSHRTWADIRTIISVSGLGPEAQHFAERTFALLAEAEGRIHGIPAEEVHFHEVGALDSILDICLCAELFVRLAPALLVCGPLPLCDGTVRCEHGLLTAPAPAVLDLLQGVPVRGIPSEGETVTPTAISLLKGLDARFGGWPEMTIRRTALVYGGRMLAGVPNGALFALGSANSSMTT